VVINNNAIYNFRRNGILAEGINKVDIIGNIVVRSKPRVADEARAGIMGCTTKPCTNLRMVSNIVAGNEYAGFSNYGHPCG